jgi:hypothetical protein
MYYLYLQALTVNQTINKISGKSKTGFVLRLFFELEDEGNIFFRNIGELLQVFATLLHMK